MKRAAIAFAFFAICGCAPRSEVEFRQTLESARRAFERGDLSRAQELAERGLSLTQANPDSERAWTFRLLRAEILLERNNLTEAAALLERRLPDQAAFDPLRGRQAYLSARLRVARGSMREALSALEQARRYVSSESDSTRLDVDELQGQIQARMGRWAEAETGLSQAADRAARTGDVFREAKALNDLGMTHLVQKRCDEALPWFERVLARPELEPLAHYARALYNAGACYARLGQFEKAIDVQLRASPVRSTVRPPRTSRRWASSGAPIFSRTMSCGRCRISSGRSRLRRQHRSTKTPRSGQRILPPPMPTLANGTKPSDSTTKPDG